MITVTTTSSPVTERPSQTGRVPSPSVQKETGSPPVSTSVARRQPSVTNSAALSSPSS
ncbi:hypothetical protein ACWGKW_30065 [Streptomyces sp. NPDC054766]